MTLPEFNRKAPGGESEGLPKCHCGDSAILPMTAAECVREWAESLPFSPEFHAGDANGYRRGWDEAAEYYLWHAQWRAHFQDVARFGIDKAERLRLDRAPADRLRPRSGVAA